MHHAGEAQPLHISQGSASVKHWVGVGERDPCIRQPVAVENIESLEDTHEQRNPRQGVLIEDAGILFERVERPR